MSAQNDTARLLDTIRAFIRRYVVLRDDHQAVTLALWVAHTHALSAAVCTPYLAILSPEKQSGKSLLLEVLQALTARGEHATNISPAALFRIIEAGPPTLLLDEVDALFKSESERAEELRGLINSGNRRGATVLRCHGPLHDVRAFRVFCAKALGGIENGTLPDTVRDRSIAIRMRRKTKADTVERWLLQRVEVAAMDLREWVADWAQRFTETLSTAEPELPDALSDRQQEAWWALLAIADLAGGEWPQAARNAAVALDGAEDDISIGVRLLAAIRTAFGDERVLTVTALLGALNSDEDLPFGGWSDGKGIDARWLSRKLKPYEIRPGTVRSGENVARGYNRDWFIDAWARYVPADEEPDDKASVTAVTPCNGFSRNREGDDLPLADEAEEARYLQVVASLGPEQPLEPFHVNAKPANPCRCGGRADSEGCCMKCGRDAA